MKVYLDGELQSGLRSAPDETTDTQNSLRPHAIGDHVYVANYAADGYMTDINFVDGLQLEPSEFASALSGKWELSATTVVMVSSVGISMVRRTLIQLFHRLVLL